MNQPMQPTQKKKGKGCLITLLIGIAILIGFIVLIAVVVNTAGDSTPTETKSELATVMDLTDEQEATMLSLFKSCGIGELSSVKKFQEGEDRTSYHIDDKETASYQSVSGTIVVWVDNATKTVQEIYFNDNTIYADGKVQGQLPDYYVSKEAREKYLISAELLVNQCLNYPDTAEYPASSTWRYGVQDGYDVVQSTVTAQNAFGVQDTMQFSIKFDRKTGNAVSLILDGKEYIS